MVESVKKIITPVDVDYQTQTIAVVSVAIVVKIILGLYVRHRGKKLNSGSLIGSGIDALFDAVISTATLIAIIFYFVTGKQIEAYLAAAISLVIIFSGLRMIWRAFSILLGERADPALTQRIKKDIAKIDGVNGAFDLFMHDYGNGFTVASVNIEVNHALTAAEIDDLSRLVQKTIYKKYRIILSSVGIYAIDLDDPVAEKYWRIVNEIADRYEHIINIHGFNVDQRDKEISFDIVVGFTTPNRRSYYQKFCREVQVAIPDYAINVVLDADISD